MFKLFQDTQVKNVVKYRLNTPSFIKGGMVELEILFDEDRWSKVRINPIMETEFFSAVNFFKKSYLSFAATSKFLAQILLSKYQLDTKDVSQLYFQTPYQTIIFQDIKGLKTFKIEVPTSTEVLVKTYGLLGFTKKAVKIVVHSTDKLDCDLDCLFRESLENYDSSEFKDSLNTKIERIARYSNVVGKSFLKAQQPQIDNYKTLSSLTNVRVFYEHLQERIKGIVEMLYSKKIDNLSKSTEVPNVDFSTVDNQWNKITAVISDKN
ncbi:hypothetical protein [Polynucleobacter rarus]|uniref:hypothetical protein n=1 Tax=Polynucleobacter rarus TaxID=556055 RepID=UPI000D3ECEE3|nr:hypothetical protein [Polynucleobacter rarus]